VRVIAATNKKLEEEISKDVSARILLQVQRDHLYHTLAREGDGYPILVEHFLKKLNEGAAERVHP
jgi:DNA-binding NtrC family response regulator